MRGVGLLFIAVVAATPGGRAAVDEYATKFGDLLATQAPYSYVIAGIVTVSVLVCLLMMGASRKERPPVYLVRREVRGENLVTISLNTGPRRRLRSTI